MRLFRAPALLLAAMLQLLPLSRIIATHPAVASTFAIVLRWGFGAATLLGTYDGVSGASVLFTSPTTATGIVGVAFSYKATIINNGADLGAQFAAAPLPPGLTATVFDSPPPPSNVYGIISGTPTQATNNMRIFLVFSGKDGWGAATTNLFLTILPASPPQITNQPAGLTNLAGSTVVFDVGASSSSTPGYQWRLNGTNLTGTGANRLTLTNVRTNQSGDYSVVVTNSSGSVTSAPARLLVTVPPPPGIASSSITGNQFRFTFTPVIGLTNAVLTNGSLDLAGWGVLTNVPPPVSANSITITDTVGTASRFYRVKIDP